MNRDNLLIVADSEHDANMLYAAGLFAPDPFVYLRLKGKCHLLVGEPELRRARRVARHCRVHSLQRLQERLPAATRPAGFAPIIHEFLRGLRIRKVFVPANFPYGLARELRHLGVKLKLKNGPLFPERALKKADEVKKISAALIMAEVGLAEGIQVIKASRIGKNRQLLYRNAPLTSDRLRAIMHTAIYQAGGQPGHTIVAVGRQACDPHEPGHGPLKAHAPIVLDVFPRSQKTGYFGDITRTVVKGRASEAVRRLFHTVAFAQQLALAQLQPRSVACKVHHAVAAYFAQQGFATKRANGASQGFFHALGHGVGLEIHEAPRLSENSVDLLEAGQVVTLEPGLYYPEIGGLRLEDVVLITRAGARNLTQFEKQLEV